MICHDARELFTPLADDGLGPSERAEVQGHLADCLDCRRDWQRFQRTLTAMHDLPTLRAPIGFVDRAVDRARGGRDRVSPRPRRLLRRLFVPLTVKVPIEVAALALISLAGVYVAWQGLELQRRPVPATTAPPEAARDREATAPAREESADRRAARNQILAMTPPIAGLRLTTTDIDGAERLLADALKHAGGAEIGRRTEGDSLVVEAEVPRAGWRELGEALRRAGPVVVESEPTGAGNRLRLVVRIGP